MVEYINAHPEDRDIINAYGSRIFGIPDTVNTMLKLARFIEENELANTRCMSLKMELNNLINYPHRALEFMTAMLIPDKDAQKERGAVYTSKKLIDTMLGKLPANAWTNPKLTFYDPASGIGNFMVIIYYRLMKGLCKKIPDDEERRKHILENMIFMSELDPKSVRVCHRLFNADCKYDMNLHSGDSLAFKHHKEPGWPKRFDLIVGNPPYNLSFNGTNGYAPALYHKFVEKYIEQCDKLLFVLPTRGFTGGRGLDAYRDMMLKRRDIVYIDTIPDSDHPFGTAVQIKGGVCHFLKDISYKGKCSYNGRKIYLDTYDILVDCNYIPIIDRILKYDSITESYCSKGHYKIPLTDKRLHDKKKTHDVVCHVSKSKGSRKYIDGRTISDGKLGKWKIITVTASTDGGGFGNMFVAGPNDVHSESYISFEVKSKKAAESLVSLLQCRLSNLLLAIRKPHTHNIAKEACKWIPAVPLDRAWDDKSLYKYLQFTKTDVKLVEGAEIPGFTQKTKAKKRDLVVSSSEEDDYESHVQKNGGAIRAKRKQTRSKRSE